MHLKVHGALEPMPGERLAELAEAVSLRGRGGAGFPFGKKLRAVTKSSIRRGVRPVVALLPIGPGTCPLDESPRITTWPSACSAAAAAGPRTVCCRCPRRAPSSRKALPRGNG